MTSRDDVSYPRGLSDYSGSLVVWSGVCRWSDVVD